MPSWAPGETAAMRMETALIVALDEAANRIYDRSQLTVPRSETGEKSTERYGETLAESGRSPRTDPELGAAPDKFSSRVEYEAPYAAAQEEGHALMDRDGHIIEWSVVDYSTPGTGPKFLENALKEEMLTIEETIGASIRAALEL